MSSNEYFSVGTEVEVSSDEDGFKGALFRATIIAPFNGASKVLVQYRNLVTEDASDKLRENVDLAHLRPIPPVLDCPSFHLGDIVDAHYKDGLWTGVVKKVLRDSTFRVFFDNPPDMIDFHINKLRLHQDWTNNQWTRPKREPQMTGSHFSPGTDVEVTFESLDSKFRDWIPAIVVKENKDNTFLVKFQDPPWPNHLGQFVDFLHIRPTPPRHVDRNYVRHDKVDVYNNSAWSAAKITKVVSGKSYRVSLCNGGYKEVGRAELRPRAEWNGGKWEIESKEISTTTNSTAKKDSEPAPKKIKTEKTPTQLEIKSGCDDKLEKIPPDPPGKKLLKQQADQIPEETPSAPVSNSNMTEITPTALDNGVVHGRPQNKLKDGDLSLTKSSDRTQVKKKSPIILASLESPARLRKPPASFKFENYSAKKTRSKQQSNSAVKTPRSLCTKRGRPRKTEVRYSEPLSNGTIQSPSIDATEKSVVDTGANGAAKVSSRITSNSEDVHIVPSNVSSQILEEESQISNVEPKQEPDELKEDQSLVVSSQLTSEPILIGLLHSLVLFPNMEPSQPKANGTRSIKRKRGRPRKISDIVKLQNKIECVQEMDRIASPMNEVVLPNEGDRGGELSRQGNTVGDGDRPISEELHEPQSQSGAESKSTAKIEGLSQEIQELPFTKTSPIWEVIESMEVFRVMPQTPHFRPLYDCKEECREGLAIGNLVTFSGLVEKISKLRFEDRGDIYTSTLESLLDLEKQGFKVKPLRDRVVKLSLIKEKIEPVQRDAKDIETKITERKGHKTCLSMEIEEVERKLSELKEKHKCIRVQIEIKDIEVNDLQQSLDVSYGSISKLRRDYEELRASPFNLT